MEQDSVVERFSAVRLRLSPLPGTVVVRVWDGDGMRVEIADPTGLVVREVRRKTLHVRGPRRRATAVIRDGMHRATIKRGLSSASIVAKPSGWAEMLALLGVAGLEPVSGVHVTVDVPWQTPTQVVDSTVGLYRIGDVNGPLDLRLGGVCEARVGRVGPTRIDLASLATADVEAVAEKLRITHRGRKAATIRAGTVERLKATVSGSARVMYDGVAAHARLVAAASASTRSPRPSVRGKRGPVRSRSWSRRCRTPRASGAGWRIGRSDLAPSGAESRRSRHRLSVRGGT